ncbi:MAG: nucleoside deaminase [Candidatus Omnitrophota bacterium]
MEKNKKNHALFMQKAISEAKTGIMREQAPFGACIVLKNKAISSGHNQVWQNTDITAQAELIVIRRACAQLKTINLSGCIIYSTCEPCPMCFSACHWSRLSAVVYGASIKDARKNGFNELDISNAQIKRITKTRIKIIPGILKKDNLKLFEFWAKQNKGQIY